MKAHVKKTISGWSPADQETDKYWRSGKIGDIYHFDIRRVQDQRNWRHLQKYWVMLEEVTRNQERYRTKEELHDAIKRELGIVEIREDMKGNKFKIVGSVSMNKMNQEEFNLFYSDAINLILRYVLIGTTEEELNNRVMEILRYA